MKNIFLMLFVAGAATQFYGQCACCAGAGIGSSNGDYNNGILTLPKKTFVAETYADYRTIKNGDAPEDDEKLLKNMTVMSVGARYGITKKITVSALLPYVFLHTNSGDDKGLGDLIVMGTFSVYAKNNFNLALQTGVELPTGIRKDSNFDNTTVIVGSGSYDPMLGLALSKSWNKFTLQGNALYKWTTKGFDSNYYGNLSTHNLTLSYKIKEGVGFCTADTTATKEVTDLKKESKLGISIFSGYYGEWLDKLKEDDVVDENSGHYLGFLTLGANTTVNKWAFPVTVSLPLISNLNGEQNAAGFRLRIGIIRSF